MRSHAVGQVGSRADAVTGVRNGARACCCHDSCTGTALCGVQGGQLPGFASGRSSRVPRLSWPVATVRTVVALLTVCMCGALGLAGCSSGESEEEAEARRIAETLERLEAENAPPSPDDYEVGPDGNLLQPDRALEEPTPSGTAALMTDIGAQAFAQYYMNLIAYSWSTGNTTTLTQRSTTDCTMCQGFITSINERYAQGG